MNLTQNPPQNTVVKTEKVNVKQLWDDTLVGIELEITPANFKTWFRDTHIVSLEDGTVTLGVPSVFVRDWLRDKFQSMILRVLRSISPHARSLEYVVVQHNQKKRAVNREQVINSSLPLEEYYINKKDNLTPKYIFDTFVVGPFNALAHTAAKTVTNLVVMSVDYGFIFCL